MAERNFSVSDVGGYAIVLTYTGVQQGDTCAPIPATYGHDRTVHVEGTFGGATVSIKGSLRQDGGSAALLSDPQGNVLTFTSPRVESVLEAVRFMIPEVAGGDATTSINIHVLCRSTHR